MSKLADTMFMELKKAVDVIRKRKVSCTGLGVCETRTTFQLKIKNNWIQPSSTARDIKNWIKADFVNNWPDRHRV